VNFASAVTLGHGEGPGERPRGMSIGRICGDDRSRQVTPLLRVGCDLVGNVIPFAVIALTSRDVIKDNLIVSPIASELLVDCHWHQKLHLVLRHAMRLNSERRWRDAAVKSAGFQN
jgi:hypothetical protein